MEAENSLRLTFTDINHLVKFEVIPVIFFFFLRYWGLNLGPSPWATPPVLFLFRIFQDRVLQTICELVFFGLGVVVHICNPSILEAEAGRSWFWGQPRLHRETLSKTNEQKKDAFRKWDLLSKTKGLVYSSNGGVCFRYEWGPEIQPLVLPCIYPL
jgi:hypothetical protein